VSDGDRWPDAPELDDPPETEDTEAETPVEEEVSATPPDTVSEPVSDTAPAAEHAEGDFSVPDGYGVLQGKSEGGRRAVGVVVSRFNGAVTSKLLEGALAELDSAGVARDAITVMPVPGAFELPIAAMALAKTRRYACIVALGCVIRGDTPHFYFAAGEAASGLQLAALETGVPVAFGLLTLEQADQADDRLDKGAEAVRTGLEMADVFAQLRAAAQR
jgi:6,7-dimethyl-8-ribityllumazine synthase